MMPTAPGSAILGPDGRQLLVDGRFAVHDPNAAPCCEQGYIPSYYASVSKHVGAGSLLGAVEYARSYTVTWPVCGHADTNFATPEAAGATGGNVTVQIFDGLLTLAEVLEYFWDDPQPARLMQYVDAPANWPSDWPNGQRLAAVIGSSLLGGNGIGGIQLPCSVSNGRTQAGCTVDYYVMRKVTYWDPSSGGPGVIRTNCCEPHGYGSCQSNITPCTSSPWPGCTATDDAGLVAEYEAMSDANPEKYVKISSETLGLEWPIDVRDGIPYPYPTDAIASISIDAPLNYERNWRNCSTDLKALHSCSWIASGGYYGHPNYGDHSYKDTITLPRSLSGFQHSDPTCYNYGTNLSQSTPVDLLSYSMVFAQR